MKFQDQVVVVTGGTRGIGRAVAEAFLDQGAEVVVTYRQNQEAAKAFEDSRERLKACQFDVGQANEVGDFYAWLQDRHGRLDVLVNNGGVRRDQLLASLPERDWDEVLNTNLKGTYLMSRGAVPPMLKRRYGRIVNVGSIGGRLGFAGQANYAASKAGQVALAKSLGKEVARKGITVNNVLPGYIRTDLIADLPPAQFQQVPMRRVGEAKEVAFAVCFLASTEASYITGASLEVSGGL